MIKRIHFVEFNAKINTLAIRKVFPKYGTPLLATILKEKGYDVRIYLEGVSRMDFEKMTDCDLICMPVFAPAYNKVKDFSKRVFREKPHIPVIVGGPQAILYTETVLDFCSYAVRCEGDEVLPELIECLSKKGDIGSIKGISYMENGEPVHTPDREPPKIPSVIPDMSLIKGFKRAARGPGRLENIQNTLQTSRGCNFRCKFCPTSRLFSGVYRNRDVDSIITEIKAKKEYNDWFLVVDNSFLGNREKTVALLNRLIQEDLGASLIVFERHEIGNDINMLKLMKKAGVDCLIVGVESLVDNNLDAFNKKQKVENVVASIRNIKKSGIHVIGTFAFGYDGDTKERALELVAFIKKNNLALNLFILHDTVMEDRKDLLISMERRFQTYYEKNNANNTDFYDYATGNFVTYFPKQMKPSTLQQCILDIYEEVYTHKYILRNMFSKNIFESLFGIAHGYGIRRMNKNISKIVSEYYLDYLKQIEQGLYDENEVLIEEKLKRIQTLPIPRPLVEQAELSSYQLIMTLGFIPGISRYYLQKLGRRIRKTRQIVGVNEKVTEAV